MLHRKQQHVGQFQNDHYYLLLPRRKTSLRLDGRLRPVHGRRGRSDACCALPATACDDERVWPGFVEKKIKTVRPRAGAWRAAAEIKQNGTNRRRSTWPVCVREPNAERPTANCEKRTNGARFDRTSVNFYNKKKKKMVKRFPISEWFIANSRSEFVVINYDVGVPRLSYRLLSQNILRYYLISYTILYVHDN